MHISALAIYPVKSLGPVALEQAEITPSGLGGDRRWMIVDELGRFVTRRELPLLARIGISLDESGFRLSAPGGEALLPATSADGALVPVTVWRDTVAAYVVENDASRLISHIAGRTLRLAYMPEEAVRPVDPKYAHAGERVSFADAFPILVATEDSLAALNATLEVPVEMARFRPNIVLSGTKEAWVERGWSALETGNVRLRLPKACIRCIVITQQSETGERCEGNAVPKALRRLGQFGPHGALFGMNAVPERAGLVAVGGAVSASG